MIKKIRLLIFLLLMFYIPLLLAKENGQFYIFDAMTYINKPNLLSEGLTKTNLLYQQFFYPNNHNNFSKPPEKTGIDKLLARYDNNCNIILDIEKWPLFSGSQLNAKNLEQYLYVLNYVKSKTNTSVGYYGLVPKRDYFSAISSLSFRRTTLSDKNLALKPLADEVDVFYPSLYTFYNKPSEWRQFAIESIKEARKLSPEKSVYVFLWPRFHESNKRLKNDWIPSDFWRLQLETAYEYADGIVIWGGWDLKSIRKLEWNDQWQWWIETKDFIKELQSKNNLKVKDCE